MSDNFSFHASVSEDAMSKVNRLFNASLDDIFAELFQNARRAGSSRVTVDRVVDDELGPAIRIADNGMGITDFRSLFTLGNSQWSSEIRDGEDAAGMGFFSLAGRHVRICARQAGTDRSWKISASPDAFSGKELVFVSSGPTGHKGVEITFSSPEHEPCIPAANNAAEFFPLPVIAEGAEAGRKDFLDGASFVETWNGIRIGVFHEPASYSSGHANVNFHGVTLNAPLPTLNQTFHKSYFARLDVIHCAKLKMVLPARKEVVRDAFFDELNHAIEHLYFRLIAREGVHSLSFKRHARAKVLGLDLPEAARLLRRFSASHADRDSDFPGELEGVSSDALIFTGGDEPVDDQNLAWLIDDDGFPNLFEPCPVFEGYAWYDRLHRLELTGYRIMQGEEQHVVPAGDICGDRDRPDRLFLEGTLTGPTDVQPWQSETDRLILAPPSAHIDEAAICVTRSSRANHDDLVDHLTRALFCPSDDYDAGRYDDQLQWFTDEAEDAVIAYLETPGEVRRHQTIRAVKRELWWLMKQDSAVTIHIRGSDVDVFGMETAFQTEDKTMEVVA